MMAQEQHNNNKMVLALVHCFTVYYSHLSVFPGALKPECTGFTNLEAWLYTSLLWNKLFALSWKVDRILTSLQSKNKITNAPVIPLTLRFPYLGRNLSWALKLDWAWIKPVFGRISMCFLISRHTSKVSIKAVVALLYKRYGFINITSGFLKERG